MEFKKYPSIENSYRKNILTKIKTTFPDEIKQPIWFVTEKIHGSNFAIYTDGVDVQGARRLKMLDKEETFYNSQQIIQKYKQNVLNCYKELKMASPFDIVELIIYGELCGGTYPHLDVPRNPTAKKVQKEIFYTPNNEFLVFDIALKIRKIHNTQSDTIIYKWIDQDFMYSICRAYNFKTAPLLFTGTFDESLAYPNNGESQAYKIFNLPKIENNMMEGVVIKPNKSLYFHNGDRVIIKNKNSIYSEINKVNHKQTESTWELFLKSAPNDIQQIFDETESSFKNYICDNRLKSVLSKIQPIQAMNQFGMVLGMFSKDVLTDFLKDHPNIEINLDKKQQKIISKEINKSACCFLKERWNSILNEKF